MKLILKPTSHCAGLVPWYVSDDGPGETVSNGEDNGGSTVANRDDP